MIDRQSIRRQYICSFQRVYKLKYIIQYENRKGASLGDLEIAPPPPRYQALLKWV